jgi:hypothetical protein
VADYNRAQFRLYRALGHPAQCLAGAMRSLPAAATPAPTPTFPQSPPAAVPLTISAALPDAPIQPTAGFVPDLPSASAGAERVDVPLAPPGRAPAPTEDEPRWSPVPPRPAGESEGPPPEFLPSVVPTVVSRERCPSEAPTTITRWVNPVVGFVGEGGHGRFAAVLLPGCGVPGRGQAWSRELNGDHATRSRRMLRCSTCEKRFSERKGTPLFDFRLPAERVVSILSHVVEGNESRQTARLTGTHPTALNVLARRKSFIEET